MSPTLKKIRKEYVDFSNQRMPWYLKEITFFTWFVILSSILIFEPGAESQNLPLLDQIQNPSDRAGVKIILSLILVSTTMLILRHRWIVRSSEAKLYLEKIYMSFTTNGQQMLTEELRSTIPYLQVFSTTTAAFAFFFQFLA
ncbi:MULTISPECIES: hypothetical protein [Leuconostoc]|uniref:hypothetical protein n=1 Tax=Leuconostoc TaxID=1243 RepID=UPI0002466109|nr:MULTISPECIES: hypothetical protein [Leuconostoc]MBA5937986.1 hypothetical protein [Leuconostoc citreum]MDV8932841.1 hypothetical protein [Leuconostoc citreum]QEA55164.1 hypothetical protein FGL76_03560 [Leuconostoc citreum]QOG10693.1 hypothetical protein FAZ25_07520 [Leuconostoc sp. LN180020]CCF25158.1 Protein of unknown function [Leuconostoc citreum LBAE C10]